MFAPLAPLAAVGWPVLDRFRFGDVFAVSPHGVLIAVGFLIGAWLLGREGPRRGLDPDDINSMVAWAIVGTIIGARLFYVIAHYSDFEGDVVEILSVWKGGISLLGGIAGAILINLPKFRRRGYRFFQVMDAAVIALALGIAIGRVGDLIIGDHLGKPTSFVLAFQYRGGEVAPPFSCEDEQVCRAMLEDGSIVELTRDRATMTSADGDLLGEGDGVHQTALYDIIGAWPLFFLLRGLNRRLLPRTGYLPGVVVRGRDGRRHPTEGVLTLVFGAWYGSMRLITDFLRVDKRFFGLTGSQWTALTVVTISVLVLLAWAVRSRRREESPAAA